MQQIDRTESLKKKIQKARKLQREVAETISEAKGTGVQFILQELATGIAFAKLSHDSRLRGEIETAGSQEARAREAQQTVRKFLPDATPTRKQKATIEASLAELESKLSGLEAYAKS